MPHDMNSNEVFDQEDAILKLDPTDEFGVKTFDPVASTRLSVSHPDLRRLRQSFRKLTRKPPQQRKSPPPVVRMSKADHGSKQSGGHIIPASSLQIMNKELGRGEFGKVMQGIWTDQQGQKTQVAVKCLNPEKVSIDKHQQDFVKEAAIMYSLSHEHLVRLFGVVLDADSSLMLVTEFAPLRSLAENIKQVALKASFPITLLVDFCIQISDAMRYLHSSSIIHRDLATRNILLFINEVGTKTVKISDFGLSRRLLLGENYRSEMSSRLPLAWMPVEALTKLTFTKASDVYSFGVSMWEMFSYGSQPWGTLSGEEILRGIDKPNFQRLVRPEACPQSVYDIMLKCWSHQPDERPTFNEIHSQLPQARPQQVRAVSSHVASSPDELTYRTDDIITVIESSDRAGMWTGISPLGKIGKFECTKTSATGSGPTSPTRESKKGSKIKRAKSNKSKDKEVVKRRINKGDIGIPSNYKHIFHVGCDGQVEGDPTFGGTNYSNIPVNSISVEKSPQTTKRANRPTQLPPPPAPPPGGKAPSKASPERLEPLEASQSYQLEASPDILHGTSDGLGARTSSDGGLGARTENNHNDLIYQNGKNSPEQPTTPDEFSSFEMGSLLEECLSAWESVDTQLKMSAEEDELEGEALKRVNANCTANNRSNKNQGQARSGGAVAGGATNDIASSLSSYTTGGLANPIHSQPPAASPLPDSTLNLHNMIIKDRICTQRQTRTFLPRKAHTLGHMSSSSRRPQEHLYSSTITGAPAAQSSARGPLEPQQGEIPRASRATPLHGPRQEQRWKSEFKRLSSRTQGTGENEYLDDLETPPLSPLGGPANSITAAHGPSSPPPQSPNGRMRAVESALLPENPANTVPAHGPSFPPPRSPDRRMRAVKSAVKRSGYEELSKAISPDPGSYFTFVDQGGSNSSTNNGNVKNGTTSQNMSIRREASHPAQEHSHKDGINQSPPDRMLPSVSLPNNSTLFPAKMMQSSQVPPTPEPSPQGVAAYDMLIGGEISTSPRCSRASLSKRTPPAVPPKPLKRGQSVRPESKMSFLDSRCTGKEQRDSDSKNVFGSPNELEVPPLPPREPVSPMHQATSRLKSSVEGTPIPPVQVGSNKSPDRWGGAGDSPQREENNNNVVDGSGKDGVVYRLSAGTLERLEQEEQPRRRRRSVGEARRRRRQSSGSDSSDHSPVKTPGSLLLTEAVGSPGPSPQRLPNLLENDQTNRPPNPHTTTTTTIPPLPPRSHPSPPSPQASAGPASSRTQLDSEMCSPPLHSITQISGEALALPDSAPDALESSLSATMQPGPSETQFTDPWMLMPSSESKLSAHRVTPESSQDESVWSSTQPDPFTSRTELDSSIPKFEQLSDLPSQEVHGAIPKTKFECRTIMTDGIQPVCANHGCEGGSHDSSSSSLLTPPDPFRVTTSCEPMKTSSSVLQNTMKNLRTLSPRSSPRHTASERKELPNCYAQEEDGLDLPPPHTPLVPVGNCGEKPAVPPKPPPRGPYMKRCKTVDVACDMGKPLLSHADRKIKWGGNKANTVATDRDFAERSQLKSASFDKCIIDTEDNFLLSTPRCIRGILEMQGHSFETPDDFVDQEPDYPPPPVPLEEPTVMTEKHIPFRVPLLPEPPEPMSPEDRAFVLKTLERQNSVPLSLAFEDDFARERRLSCGSNSSSATYISPRSSSIAPKTIQVPPALNGVPTPIKRVPLVTDERYNVPRKIPEADLLRYNISQTTQNTVSFTPVGDPRQSVMSDIVRELDYEIVVFERSARKNGTPPDQAYEAMKFNQSSSGPGTIYSSMSLQTAANGTFIQQRSESGYVNASRPTASRTADCGTSPTEEGESSGRMQGPSTIEPTGSASTGANQGYAVMSLGRPKVGKRDVRRARSVDNLLGSTDECLSTSSRHDNLPEQTTFAASDIPTRPTAPPPADGHVFEKSAPGYIRMRGSTKQRSSSVCLLSKPAEH